MKINEVYYQGEWIGELDVQLSGQDQIESLEVLSPSKNCEGPWNIPGFINAHSHAFQFAMAGEAECVSGTNQSDDFWTWRKGMYELALQMSPEQLYDVGKRLYRLMKLRGYSWVVEFHYLHHDPEGNPYTNPSEMAESLLKAAEEVGIGITMVPIFYQAGGFGKEPQPEQRRFISNDLDQYLKIFESLKKHCDSPTKKLGMGVHSLRAITAEAFQEFVKNIENNYPVHIHISEQTKEVDDCLNYYKASPIEWLFDHAPVNDQWSLVHATHANGRELRLMAESKCNVVLCPSTEANLGDGIFPLVNYQNLQGRWCIGSDSHIVIDPLEELRWVDWGQRLIQRKRNILCQAPDLESGDSLYRSARKSGRRSAGFAYDLGWNKGETLDLFSYSPEILHNPLPSEKKRLSSMIYRR